VPTSGVIVPSPERATPGERRERGQERGGGERAAHRGGMPGRPIMSEVTTKSATSMATPRSLAGPAAGRGEAARSDTAAQPR
jgi:hypothetical protein